MTSVTTYVPGFEWTLGSGTWPDQSAACKSGGVCPEDNPTIFKYADTVCGFVNGPSPLGGATASFKAYVDTVVTTTDDDNGEVTVTATRVYQPYELTAMDIVSSLPASPRQFDPNFVGTGGFPYIRPTQYGGCILWHETLGAKATGFDSGAGVADTNPTPAGVKLEGFIATDAGVGDLPLTTAANTYVITLDNGAGFMWQWNRFMIMDVVQPIIPIEIEVQTVMELPCDVAVGTNAWVRIPPDGVANLPLGLGGVVYYAAPNSTDEANKDPFPEWFQCTDPPPLTLSGYAYLDVFDKAKMSYVERCSHQMDVDYIGQVSIRREGYFPTQPLDPNFINPTTGEPNPLYPMDSVTQFVPDSREKVTVEYTISASATFGAYTHSETITVYQDVLAPQEDWPTVLNGLLNTCYFTNGFYESYEFLLAPRPDSNYIPMDNLPIRPCEEVYYQE